MHQGVAPGYGGWRDDARSFLAPWGFDVTAFTIPVAVWFGDQDRMVPTSHGEWLASKVPGAIRHRLVEEGHLSFMVDRFGDVLDDLCALGGLPW